MIISGFEGTSLNASTEELIVQQGIGGLIIFERNYKSPDQLQQLINDLQSLMTDNPELPSLFISVDQEGGRVARLGSPFTQFPPMSCLGKANSNELAYRFGLGMGKELRAVGVNMDYAPVLDVHSNSMNHLSIEYVHDLAMYHAGYPANSDTNSILHYLPLLSSS